MLQPEAPPSSHGARRCRENAGTHTRFRGGHSPSVASAAIKPGQTIYPGRLTQRHVRQALNGEGPSQRRRRPESPRDGVSGCAAVKIHCLCKLRLAFKRLSILVLHATQLSASTPLGARRKLQHAHRCGAPSAHQPVPGTRREVAGGGPREGQRKCAIAGTPRRQACRRTREAAPRSRHPRPARRC